MTSEEFDQPIHQVLSNYSLLEVSPCEDVHFSLGQALSWRMNLCAISQLYPTKYFIAVNDKICVYGISNSLVFTPQPIMVLQPSTNASEFMINAIKVGPMKFSSNNITHDEILVVVGDNGEIFAWNTHTLFTNTTDDNNTSENTNTTPFFHRYNVDPTLEDDEDDPSTWGIAIHMDGLIAVSANNHRITIYNLWSSNGQGKLGKRSKVVLAGHTHNIPCIDFDSSGRYLASGSIDMTCRLWDLTTLQQVGQRIMTRSQDSSSWLWAVKFIPTGHFKSATCHHSMLTKRFQQQHYQGRGTNTTDLHLEHSARAPIYQLDMHQMFHRLRTGDLTDEEEDELNEDPTTMSQLIRLRRMISERIANVTTANNDDQTATDTPPLQQQEEDAADAELLDWEDDAVNGLQDTNWGSESGGDEYDDEDFDRLDPTLEEHEYFDGTVWDDPIDDDDDDFDSLVDDDDDELEQPPNLDDLSDNNYNSNNNNNEDNNVNNNNNDNDGGGGGGWGDEWQDESVLDTGHLAWNTNQREDYDDLLAEEQDWMQDRSQFPWHWSGVQSGRGGDQDRQVTSLLQDDDTTDKATSTTTTTTTLDIKVLAPPITGNIPYTTEPCLNSTTRQRPPMDYLMLTSKKDAYLLHPMKLHYDDDEYVMPTMQRERGVVSRADARTAFALDMMERLCFVEWVPDLELCVVASQKGCVALMRMIQVQWPHEEQSCLFNHESYLPLRGLQNSVLYGMTIHRLPSEHDPSTAPVYQLLLLYLDGTMRSYRLAKPSRHSLVDLVSVL